MNIRINDLIKRNMLSILLILLVSVLEFLTSNYQAPVITNTTSLTSTKCKEYGKAVYTQETSPILSKHTQTHQISQCAIESIPLIIGGRKAKSKEFPHMAVIGFGDSPIDELDWSCGGTLISPDFILTAAHCVYHRGRGAAQKVRLGMVSLLECGAHVQERNVVQRIQHPFYNFQTKYNDIALLKMDRSVEFTPYIRPACLNTKEIPIKSQLIATGFGKLAYEADVGSTDLMKIQLTLHNRDRCKYLISSEIKQTMLCVGELGGGRDTCQGDSGGPLQIVLDDPYCMYAIVGVTSFGRFCGFPNSPALYVDVRFYLKWIEHLVWERHD